MLKNGTVLQIDPRNIWSLYNEATIGSTTFDLVAPLQVWSIVCCSVLQCVVAVVCVLQFVAVCCSVLQCVVCVLQCVAMCYSVLSRYCLAVCYSGRLCVAVCCNVICRFSFRTLAVSWLVLPAIMPIFKVLGVCYLQPCARAGHRGASM